MMGKMDLPFQFGFENCSVLKKRKFLNVGEESGELTI